VRILVVSFAFPPYNASGAVRVGKFVSYLLERGHEVRVVAADGLPYPADFECPLDGAVVVRERYLNVVAPMDLVRRSIRGRSSKNGDLANAGASRLSRKFAGMYRSLIAVPDPQVGWYRPALRGARKLTANWTPEVIFSSALPFTSHLVAARIAREIGCSWVAEFRDLFADNPYNEPQRWRLWLDRYVEKRVLAAASALVTVSQPLAETLAERHARPVLVVTNGFDPSDLPQPEINDQPRSSILKLVYTGIIYPGRRDPQPLFAAIARLGPRGNRIVVDFYGQDLRGVREVADQMRVGQCVRLHSPVSYRDSVLAQCRADVLLLLLWDDVRERGVYTGKLFEYAGARRPILAIGCVEGVAATLVRERGLGVALNHPADIAMALDRWLDEIDLNGKVAVPPSTALAGLSRFEQFARCEALLRKVTVRVHHA
jgi:glycosyltransferase involved in cell wall biosynthesis